ncbi:MAG: phospholipase D-like domain-containing protein [Bacteroidota bacterium]
MQDIIELFEQSIEDTCMSRAEKRTIKQIVQEKGLDRDQRNFLRSKIFDIASARATDENYSQVLQWLEEANKALIPKDHQHVQTESYFSPGDECLKTINGHLRSAVSSIKICVFTISDNRISDTIVESYRRGIDIKIITDDDKVFDKGSDIDYLVRKGIPIKVDDTRYHMHHKFLLIDKQKLITGSYNWTRSAAEYNHENIIVTDDQSAVNEYVKEFDRLWKTMCAYDQLGGKSCPT